MSDLEARRIKSEEIVHWELEGKDVGIAILRKLEQRLVKRRHS